jgi:hypothetical protein
VNPEHEFKISPEELIKNREIETAKRKQNLRAELLVSLNLLSEQPEWVAQNQLKDRTEFAAIEMMTYDPQFESARNFEMDAKTLIAGWLLGSTGLLRRVALLRTGQLASFNMSRAYHDLVDFSQLDGEEIIQINLLIEALVAKYQIA